LPGLWAVVTLKETLLYQRTMKYGPADPHI
jgi:hypothetical protein